MSSGLPVRATYALLAACPAVYAISLVLIGWVERRDPLLRGPTEVAPAE